MIWLDWKSGSSRIGGILTLVGYFLLDHLSMDVIYRSLVVGLDAGLRLRHNGGINVGDWSLPSVRFIVC